MADAGKISQSFDVYRGLVPILMAEIVSARHLAGSVCTMLSKTGDLF
jgi:hypothetical protein